MPNEVLPVVGLTIGNGLFLDLDNYDPETAMRISEETTKLYDCGDALLMKSSSKKQMTLFGEETYGFHVIFGKQMTEEKVQAILDILARHRVIEEKFRWFHFVEHEQTLRLNPKRKGEKWPKKFAYIHFDGDRKIIDKYLTEFKIAKKALERRCM